MLCYLFLTLILFLLLLISGRWLQLQLAGGHALFCGSATSGADTGLTAMAFGLALVGAALIQNAIGSRRATGAFFSPAVVRGLLGLMAGVVIGFLYLLTVQTCLTDGGLTVRRKGLLSTTETYALANVERISPICSHDKYGWGVRYTVLHLEDGRALYLDNLWLYALPGRTSVVAATWPHTPVDWGTAPPECLTSLGRSGFILP
ncbi:hypothetical protein FBZ88_11232 [Nitrospirillum bahiense]|uniref:Uncharacterized protein n=2 Tax=Nitrospirillum amazonense TaxID=28077 RepID=A0A560FRN3_9PROT|nr:hypothetical protein FBZ88_11232 [Nitrospirillum amazonense]